MSDNPSTEKGFGGGRAAVLLSVAIVIAMFMAAVPLIAIDVSADGTVTILTPTPDEDNIAAGRDFYVIGTYGGLDLSAGFVFSVVMKDASGATVRTLMTTEKGSPDDIYYNYKCASTWKQGADPKDFSTSMMPDLVYDSSVDGKDAPADSVPSTFLDSWRKCYVGESSFSAVVSGGVDDGVYEGLTDPSYRMRFNNVDGSVFGVLPHGEYTVDVIFTVDGEDHRATKGVTIGDNGSKLCSRFSPDDHRENALDLASENGWRAYMDPLVGYWDSQNAVLPKEIRDLGAFCEIKPKWHACELFEYATPQVNVVVYNISLTSATQTMEIGSCIEKGNLDRTEFYHYDIGEPTIATPDGEMTGDLKKYDGESQLALVRADDAEGYTSNVYRPGAGGEVLDTDLRDGVYTGDATALGLYGFALPIDAECDYDPMNGYDVKNRIVAVSYTILDEDGKALNVLDREVSLLRLYSDTYTASSVYEFMHVIDLSEYSSHGEIIIEAQALDANLAEVEGAVQTVTVHLSDKPAPGMSSTAIAIVACAVVIAAIAAAVYFRRRAGAGGPN